MSRDDYEDAIQEAILQMLTYKRDRRFEEQSPYATLKWLKQAVRYLRGHILRRPRTEELTEDTPAKSDIDETERKILLQQFSDQLIEFGTANFAWSKRHIDVWLYTYRDEYDRTAKELADLLGVSRGTIVNDQRLVKRTLDAFKERFLKGL